MQIFTIPYTASGLGNFLQEYATDYFDSFDVPEAHYDYLDTTKLIKNGYEFNITQYHRDGSYPNDHQLKINDTTIATSSNYSASISYAYVCDNAIILIPFCSNSNGLANMYNSPICICKTNNGDTMITYPYKSPFSYGDSIDVTRDAFNAVNYARLRMKNMVITSDGTLKSWNQQVIQANNNANVIATTAITGSTVGQAKDVWFVSDRPFYDHLNPFMLTLNGESYASFGYNSILVKTT